MRLRILGVAAVMAALFAVATQAQAGGRSSITPDTTAPDLYVTVNVTMTNTKFILSAHAAPRGADARFVIHNVGSTTNVFAVGIAKFQSGGQTGFRVTVKPGQKKILILFLDIRGKLPYYGGLPADNNKPGMKGVFLIGPCTHYEQVTGVGEC